jgi:hypothetical protein
MILLNIAKKTKKGKKNGLAPRPPGDFAQQFKV